MKTIIAGSRTVTDLTHLMDALDLIDWEITEVVSGCAMGADKLGEQYAATDGLPVKRFPANWDKHGRAAGVLRNIEMADYADALIALWDGRSPGTAHMIKEAKLKGLKVLVMECE